MNAAVQQSNTRVHPIGIPTVSEEQALSNCLWNDICGIARTMQKELNRRYSEALHQDRLRDKQRDAEEAAARDTTPVVVVEAPAPVSRVGVITHRVSDEEMERNLRFVRRQAAERVYHHLVDFLKVNTNMSDEDIAREFEGALFMPVDAEEGVYACEGVKIHLDEPVRIARFEANTAKRRLLRFFAESTSYSDKLDEIGIEGFTPGAEDGRGNPTFERDGVSITLFGGRANSGGSTKRFDNRLNDQQRIAAERRAKHTRTDTTVSSSLTTPSANSSSSEAPSAEEKAKTRAANIARAEGLKAAKDRKMAAFKAAHPKARKAPAAQPKKGGEKKKKGGK